MTHSKIATVQIHDAEALLLRIRDEPKNITLRLEFADLIADTEPDHAAIIRIDCAGGDLDERGAILERIRTTLPEVLTKVTDLVEKGFFEIDSFNVFKLDSVATDRGGVLWLEVDAFLEHHEALFRWAPFVTRLDLSSASEEIAWIAVLPSLRRYTTLSFTNSLLSSVAARLAASPHLAQLEVLGLYNTSLYDEDLEAILRSTAYPRLRELDISNQREGQHYDFEGFKVLAESVFASTLEVLLMNNICFSDVLNEDYDMVPQDITPIIAALPRLRHLEIAWFELGDEGLKRLIGLENNWTRLNLDRCDISVEGMKAFVESDGIKTLITLDIGHNDLGEEGVNMLLKSPLSNLERLSLNAERGGVGEAFGNAMINAPMASSLVILDLNSAKPGLGPNGTVALSTAPLTSLRRLGLHGNAIGDLGIKAIASSPNLGALRFLDIGGCGITDEGGKALANSPYLEQLKWIELGDELSEDVRQALKSRFGEGVKFEYPWTRSRFGL